MSVTSLIDGYDKHEIEAAHQEVSEAIDAGIKTRAMIEAQLVSAETAKA